MILSQMKSCCAFADNVLMLSYTSMNSGNDATSKLAPALKSVFTMAGSALAFTAK